MAAPKKYRAMKRTSKVDKPEIVKGVHSNLKLGYQKIKKLHELNERVKKIKLAVNRDGWPEEMARHFDLALINKEPSPTKRRTYLRNIFSMGGLRLHPRHEPLIRAMEEFIIKLKENV